MCCPDLKTPSPQVSDLCWTGIEIIQVHRYKKYRKLSRKTVFFGDLFYRFHKSHLWVPMFIFLAINWTSQSATEVQETLCKVFCVYYYNHNDLGYEWDTLIRPFEKLVFWTIMETPVWKVHKYCKKTGVIFNHAFISTVILRYFKCRFLILEEYFHFVVTLGTAKKSCGALK